MATESNEKIRKSVRDVYGRIARSGVQSCFPGPAPSCCGTPTLDADSISSLMGYSREELAGVPEGANLGLGCGNPVALASLREGEVVVDLGSGGGFDCFLAAKLVGETGRVIGVDMTPEMISRARENADRGGFTNTEFRLGEIEHLPVADGAADIVISNCVINLSPEKDSVYREMHRVLRPGGRLSITDILTAGPLPEEVRENLALVSACVGGAATVEETRRTLEDSGFTDIRIGRKGVDQEAARYLEAAGLSEMAENVFSATIEAVKPV